MDDKYFINNKIETVSRSKDIDEWLDKLCESSESAKFLEPIPVIGKTATSIIMSKAEENALDKKILANIMRNFRHELNDMSKKDLAAAINMPYSVLNNIENERASFTYSNLKEANNNFNTYIEQTGLPIKKDAFALCMLQSMSTGDIHETTTRMTHSLETTNLAQQLAASLDVIDIEKERVYSTYKKLSETDQAKIMERMEYIISTYEDEASIPTKHIAVLGQTACGNPIEAIDIADEFVETNELKATFALRAVGDSMSPLINDGDMLLIKQTEELEVRDIGIFQINETGFSDDEEVTCKMLKSIKDGVMTLLPLNPAYDPIVVDAKKNHVKVIGKYLGRA